MTQQRVLFDMRKALRRGGRFLSVVQIKKREVGSSPKLEGQTENIRDSAHGFRITLRI